MRFSLRTLMNYLEPAPEPAALLDAITDVGLEVEETIDLGLLSGNLIVGEITVVEPIEGAEKIRLATVNAGEAEVRKIVCGAPNIEPGQRVPVAKFGMAFPDGMVLKPRKIRGIESNGMLCSSKELGVAENADGIWILPPDAPVGKPWDALVTIKITPNRPDALCLVGIARDVAARLGLELRMPEITLKEAAAKTESRVRVDVEARRECPRYTARLVEGVAIGPSPRWLQVFLESAGLRPLNNIVDITNFVMLELGHPLHAFDLANVQEQRIVVRLATDGERMETLDGKVAELRGEDLLICDGKRPVALAGIMGGANSEIADSTRDVLIEAAYFHPSTIRRTARRLDRKTDASYRFERGMDPRKLTLALNRAAQLMGEIAGGTVLKGIVDAVGTIADPPRITLRIARVKEVLGYELTGREITDILTPLGFEILRNDPAEMLVAVPTHRVDVSIEEDLCEELARIAGYARIPEVSPRLRSRVQRLAPEDALALRVRDAFVAAGLCEAINYSFVAEGANALMGLSDARQIRVANPIHSDQSVMRRSIVPSLLQNVVHNMNHGVEDIRLFEIGKTYEWPTDEASTQDAKDLAPLVVERRIACAAIAGGAKPSWREAARDADFHDMKGVAERVLSLLGVEKIVAEPLRDQRWLHPGRAAAILAKGQRILTIGELHPAIAKELETRKRVYLLELPLDGPLASLLDTGSFSEIPKFPAALRDIALVVNRAVPVLDLERTMRKAGGALLQNVQLFDLFEGAQLGEGKRSLAFSLNFRSPDRTLNDEEINAAMDAIIRAATEKHQAALR